MFLKNLDLTTALRPSYLPDEVLLFVQDNVGLYEGYVPINFNGKPLLGRQLTYMSAGNSRSQIIKMDMST